MTTLQITSIVILLLWLIFFISTLISSRNDYKGPKKYNYFVVYQFKSGIGNIYLSTFYKVKSQPTLMALKYQLADNIELDIDEVIILNYKYLGRNKI